MTWVKEAVRAVRWHDLVAHAIALLTLAAIGTAAATGFWIEHSGPGLFVFLLVTVFVGWFLCIRIPENVLGWQILAVPALVALQLPADALGRALLPVAPEAAAWFLSFGHDRADLDTWSWMIPIGLMLTLIPLNYPTGRLPSPRWRWFAWASYAAVLLATAVTSTYTAEVYPGVPNPAHIDAGIGPVPVQFAIDTVLIGFASGGSLASLVVRSRTGSAQVRAQVSWMLWAVSLVGVSLCVDAFAPASLTVLHDWIQAVPALVPISMMIAILRFRLYEIDRIVSRTVAYAIVTALLAGVYALIVTSGTWLLPDAPSLAIAGATLAAAAVFLPVLRATRHVVDLRFDRERYDAQKIVDAFGERLRTGADPHDASADLVAAVDQTLRPAAVGIWSPRAGWRPTPQNRAECRLPERAVPS